MIFVQAYVGTVVLFALVLTVHIFAQVLLRTWASRPKTRPLVFQELTPNTIKDSDSNRSKISAPVVVPGVCSLEVKQALVPSRCCLLQSKSGQRLSGSSLASRIHKLQRLGVLFDPAIA